MSQQSFPAYAVPSPTPLSQVTAPVAFYPLATNPLSITSLIIGCIAWVIPFLGGLIAVILGHVALSQIRRRGEDGRILAITGLILGYGSLLAWFVLIVSMVTAELPAIEVPGVGTVEV